MRDEKLWPVTERKIVGKASILAPLRSVVVDTINTLYNAIVLCSRDGRHRPVRAEVHAKVRRRLRSTAVTESNLQQPASETIPFGQQISNHTL